GIDAGARFTCGAASMGPHDLLVIFTDGLIEAVNESDQEFGEPRVLAVLKSSDAAGAQATLKNLLSAVDAFVVTPASTTTSLASYCAPTENHWRGKQHVSSPATPRWAILPRGIPDGVQRR